MCEKRFTHYEIYTWTICLSYMYTTMRNKMKYNSITNLLNLDINVTDNYKLITIRHK